MMQKLKDKTTRSTLLLFLFCFFMLAFIVHTAYMNVYDAELEKQDDERRERAEMRKKYFESLE
ncbi:hypothetical protein [Metabacillus indicus]|uniref:hypothetical protein n=1 Tax=Metabacillus indicus TaxID=246786 RepID=UPI000492EF84|nr:hypothetical protein [Metabacillus indicus]KEZ47744.1 hypothetical protein AZ46_0220340 [Metabacillus indicus LMG 22858]